MTPAERKQRERDARRDAGLVRLDVWVHPDVREKVRAYAEKQTRAAIKAVSGSPADGIVQGQNSPKTPEVLA